MSAEHQSQLGTLADVPEIVALMERYWAFEGIAGFEPGAIRMLLERVLSHPHLGLVRIAREAGELVGYVIAVFVFSFEYQGFAAEIDELFVLPQARSRGVGTALLDAVEKSIAEGGCTCIQLQLGTANRTARAFYHRRGYAPRSDYELLAKQLKEP